MTEDVQPKITGGMIINPNRRYLLIRDVGDLLLGRVTNRPPVGAEFLATLAGWLDEVCVALGPANSSETAKLQRIIDDLLYMYMRYEVKKKQNKPKH